MKQFKTVIDHNLKEFDKEVTRQINYGWEIVGGTSITTNLANETIYVVSLVKEVENNS